MESRIKILENEIKNIIFDKIRLEHKMKTIVEKYEELVEKQKSLKRTKTK